MRSETHTAGRTHGSLNRRFRRIPRRFIVFAAIFLLLAGPAAALYSVKIFIIWQVSGLSKASGDLYTDCARSYDKGSTSLQICCNNAKSSCDADQGSTADACQKGHENCMEGEGSMPAPTDGGDPDFYSEPRLPGGLRLDWCKVWGGDCGAPAAHQFCESTKGFGWVAEGFGIDPDIGVTQVIGTGEVCNASYCDGFSFIQCADTRTTTWSPTYAGYRLDYCKYNGWEHPESCGKPAADYYCQRAVGGNYYATGYRKATAVGPTLILGESLICDSPYCDGFDYITCGWDPPSSAAGPDLDLDLVRDSVDNCPGTPNPLQDNSDGDLMGDACDAAPGQTSQCYDGLDNDGDGATDQNDVGCLSMDDPLETEAGLACDDGIDNDGDGDVDLADPQCSSSSGPAEGLGCADGQDDDGDGLVDLADPDCRDAADLSEYHLSPGDLVVADFDRSAVFRIDPVTGRETLMHQGEPLTQPWGVGMAPDGSVLVTDYADRLVRIDPDTGVAEIVSQGGFLRTPRGLTLHADGRVLVADVGATGIVAIDLADGSQEMFAPGPYGEALTSPMDVLYGGPWDLVYASDRDPARKKVVPIDSNSGDVLPNDDQSIGTREPWGLAFDQDGTILVADAGLDAVVRLGQYGLTTLEILDGWTLQDPRRIVVEASGTWVVTDSGGPYGTNPGEVYRLDPTTGGQTLLNDALDNPIGLAVVPTVQCTDGIDNDGDGKVDGEDLGCDDIFDDDEFNFVKQPSASCGLGYEQLGLLPLIWAVRRRLRKRR